MCNCYWQKCQLCNKKIPVHITDFLVAPEEVEVFCSQHLPEVDCFIWRVTKNIRDGKTILFRKGELLGFRSIIGELVCPNLVEVELKEMRCKKGGLND